MNLGLFALALLAGILHLAIALFCLARGDWLALLVTGAVALLYLSLARSLYRSEQWTALLRKERAEVDALTQAGRLEEARTLAQQHLDRLLRELEGQPCQRS